MARLSGPRRLTIALSGAYLLSLIVVYVAAYLITMDRLMDARGPGVALVDEAFSAVWEQAAYEARWAATGSVALVVAITAVVGGVALVARWVQRGYRRP